MKRIRKVNAVKRTTLVDFGNKIDDEIKKVTPAKLKRMAKKLKWA